MGWFSSKKKVAITEGPWDFYSFPYGDGLRASVAFNVRADAEREHKTHPHCRRVILYLPLDRVYANGLPTGEEYQRSRADEQAFIAVLEQSGVDCVKVGHMHYGAMRDIVFQVEDVGGFSAAFERWRPTCAQRRVELREQPGWTFFEEKIRPQPVHRKWIQNNHVIVALLDAGADAKKQHALEHLFLGEPAALDRVAEELLNAGLPRAGRVDPRRLMLTQRLPLDVDEITTWTLRFEALAKKLDASYDGWGAAPLR